MASAQQDAPLRVEVETLSTPEHDHPRYNHALLSLSVGKAPCALRKIHWILSVDRSGSMADSCKDGRSKTDQIKHTIRNLMSYLRKIEGTEHSIRIHGFDGTVEKPLSAPCVDNLDEATLNIAMDGLAPRGLTNIELALEHASTHIKECDTEDDERVVHVLLTDGHITAGESNHAVLADICKGGRNVRSAYLGYGPDHCSHLLETLSGSSENGAYHFVDSLEHAGMVYGEVMHRCVYEQAKDIRVTVEDGEVYDTLSMAWTSSAAMTPLESEGKRSMMIRWMGESRPQVKVKYSPVASDRLVQLAGADEVPWKAGESEEMAYQWARQRCLEAMARAKKVVSGVVRGREAQNEARRCPSYLEHAVLDAAKGGLWAAVWPMLEGHPHLVNCLPKPRRYALIHHAAGQRNAAALKTLADRGATLMQTRCGRHPSELAVGDEACLAEIDRMSPGCPRSLTKEACMVELDSLLEEMRRDRPASMKSKYKQLADDVYVTRLALSAADSTIGAMYLGARAASQGETRAYRVGDLEALHDNQTEEGRAYRSLCNGYQVEDAGTSSQASMGAVRAMGACMGSGGNQSK